MPRKKEVPPGLRFHSRGVVDVRLPLLESPRAVASYLMYVSTRFGTGTLNQGGLFFCHLWKSDRPPCSEGSFLRSPIFQKTPLRLMAMGHLLVERESWVWVKSRPPRYGPQAFSSMLPFTTASFRVPVFDPSQVGKTEKAKVGKLGV